MSIITRSVLYACAATAIAAQASGGVSYSHLLPTDAPLNGAAPTANLGFCPTLQPYADHSRAACMSELDEQEPTKQLCIQPNDQEQCCAYYTDTPEGPEITSIDIFKTVQSTPELLNSCFSVLTRSVSENPENLPFLGSLLNFLPIPPNWDSYFSHEQKNSDNPAYTEFLTHGACNLPNEHQVTAIHRAARGTDFKTLDYCLPQHSQDAFLNANAYFTSQTLQDCSISTPLSELEQIPIHQFTYPFIVVQNQCNTYISMKNGSRLTLKHANALEVHNLLSQRYQDSIRADFVPTQNTVQFFLNPGHGFFGLTCNACDHEGNSFDERIGFYPTNEQPLGALCDEESECGGKAYSDENNYLKIVIPITDQQAEKIFKKIQEIETSHPTYHLYLRNCLDVTQEIFQEISSGHFLQFFTSEQLQALPVTSQPAIQYAIYEHQYHFPIRAIASGFQKSLEAASLIMQHAMAGVVNPITTRVLGFSLVTPMSWADCMATLPYLTTPVVASLVLDSMKKIIGSGEVIVSLNEILPMIGLLGYSLYDISKSPSYTNSITSKKLSNPTQTFLAISAGTLLFKSLEGIISSQFTTQDPELLELCKNTMLLGMFALVKTQQFFNEFRAPIDV